jgi:hypothetical protein
MVVNAPLPRPGLETMMRSVVLVAAFAGLSACAPEQPGTGAGFSDYDTYREAQLTGAAPLNGAMPPVGQVPPAGFDPARVGAAIDASEQGLGAPLSAVSPAPAVQPLPQQGASYGAVIGTIDHLPLVPGLLELVGVIAVGRFAATRLVRSQERQALIRQLGDRWKAFLG